MKNHYFILWICLSILMAFQLIIPNAVTAQAKLTATVSSTQIAQNTAFTVTYSLSGGTGSGFAPPAFTGLNLIGTSHSSGGGMTLIVNGKVVQDGGNEEKWIYTLSGTKLGKINLGAAKVKVDNQYITSNTLSFEIVKGNGKTAQGQNKNQQTESGSVSTDDLYLKAYVDKTNAIVGEQITVTYKIYTRILVKQYAINKLSGFTGFWTYDLNKGQGNPIQHTEIINGSKYTVAEIRQIAMFPQKSGVLTIDPLEVECIAQIQVQGGNNIFNQFFNDPFFSSMQNVKREIKSNAITINVIPLPERDKPEPFSGAVGNFTFTAEVDRTEVKQNEAFTLKLNVKGTGNISLIDLPSPEFPSDFEVYDPETTEDITQNSNPIAGSRTYEYLIIPRNPGDFSIKPFTFNYYDPKAKTYKSISAPAINIKVAKGNGNGNKPVSQEDVELIGSDIRYMLPSSLPLTVIGHSFYNSLWFYLILLAPVLIFAAFVTIWRRRIKINSNERLRKNMRATRVARQRLNTAAKHLQQKQSDAFYIEVSKALWGYVCDKFSIQLSDLSLDMVAEILQQQDIRPDVRESLIQILNQCEFARYAPAGSAPDMEELYNKSTLIILELEQNLNTQKAKKTS